MNLNATLFAQFVVFFILAGFTMKFVWPPLTKALDERAKKIADGLAAADLGKADLAAAEKRIQIEMATAREEAARIIASAKLDAEQQVTKARDALRGEVANLAVKGAEQILKREVNASAHADLLNQLKTEL